MPITNRRPRREDKARGWEFVLAYLAFFGFGGLSLYLWWQLVLIAWRWIA